MVKINSHDKVKDLKPLSEPRLETRFTTNPDEIQEALRLRYRVFALGMGASVSGAEQGLDKDQFDDFCKHLIVKDLDANKIVGYSRILTNKRAKQAGGFYSATEFDLTNLLNTNKKLLEIGRTCVDPDFRGGPTIAQLWYFLADYMKKKDIDYLMGCCSIPTNDGYVQANATMQYIRKKYLTSEDLRVIPKVPVPNVCLDEEGKVKPPSLLKAYLRLGVRICGELCLDKDFGVADAFILLEQKDLDLKYLKRIRKG